MSDADADDRLEPRPVTDETVLFVDDPHFERETVCLVIGAGSGIGRATALAMAANGTTVVATDVDEAGLAGTWPTTATSRPSSRRPPGRERCATSPTSRACSTSTPSRRSPWRPTTGCTT